MSLKLLLTGEPKSGKSTILKQALHPSINSAGYITEEVVFEGRRTGFISKSSDGESTLIASDSIISEVKVGRFYVQIQDMDLFFSKNIDSSQADLLYLDEVGQMQLMSSSFKKKVIQMKTSTLPLLINVSKVYSDQVIDELINDDESVLLSLTVENRSEVSKIVDAFILSSKSLRLLTSKQITLLTSLCLENNSNLTSIYKLFNNSIPYLIEKKISVITNNTFEVKGNTRSHTVTYKNDLYICDCDFFNGLNRYKGNYGICSHIFAVRLFLFR